MAQAARRLVEHDDARAAADRGGDLYDLLLRDGQLAEPATDVQARVDLGEHGGGTTDHLFAHDEPASRRQGAEAKIFRDRKIIAERQFLVHHADTGRERVTRTPEMDLASMNEQATGVWRVNARENLSERALSGAVLPAQSVT